VNCSKSRCATSSVFVHRLFAFCRHSPQLILRLYYVSSRPSAVGNFAERLPTIPELIDSVNTSAFLGTDLPSLAATSGLPVARELPRSAKDFIRGETPKHHSRPTVGVSIRRGKLRRSSSQSQLVRAQ